MALPTKRLAEFFEILVRHIWRLAGISLLVSGAIVLAFLLRGRTYSATSSFTPTTSVANIGRASSIAAQFGIPMSSPQSDPPEFYTTLLRSRDVLREVVLSEFKVPGVPGREETTEATLLEVYAPGATPADTMILHKVIRSLRSNIGVSTNIISGVVTLTTKAKSPELAEQINRRILKVADAYNSDRRSEQARTERAFIEERLKESRARLSDAEAELENFLLENRSYASSPSLTAEIGRLQRQVDQQLQITIALAQSYEQARIEEVRNTPVISIVDPPEGSGLPTVRLLVILAMAGFLGLGAAIIAIFLMEYFRRERIRAAVLAQ